MKNRISGIYLITERETGKGYVGQSIDIEGRWKRHKRTKFPEDRFDYRVVIKADACFLDALEQLYIEQFKTLWTEGGFNQTSGGQFYPRPEEPFSPEVRKKLSESHKGKPLSEEHKKRSGEARRGKKKAPHTEESKKKISESKKGKKLGSPTEEHKKKISESKKGKPKSEETRKKMSESFKGRIQTEETKRKISETMKAKKLSVQTEQAQ